MGDCLVSSMGIVFYSNANNKMDLLYNKKEIVMEQYIPKSALVAEIESYKNSFCDRNGYLEDRETNGLAYDTLCELEDSIDNLEVKEVDLEVELNNWRHNHFHGRRDKDANGEYLERVSQLGIAKHFFELGLKIAQKEE